MKKIESIDRNQIQMSSLDMLVDKDSIVRLIDVFLDLAEVKDLGFKTRHQRTGRPAFPGRSLLGIYIYGYLNRIRSSRALEKACKVNIEMMWLIKGHRPCYKTIANFRKNNRKAFGNLFSMFRDFCLDLDLYGKQVVAIDGSKFRAQNSMKNNFTKKKIERHLEYIETKEQEYLDSLDEEDADSGHERLAQLRLRKAKYQELKNELENSDETQISTTDPDARSLPLHMRIVEVSYNLQSAVDAKHNLVVDYQVSNKNDHRALAPMSLKVKVGLHLGQDEKMIVLADKGYHTGEQMQRCHENNIETIVAFPRKSKHIDKTKPPHVHKDRFSYKQEDDTYICPSGKILRKQATYKRKDRQGKASMSFDRYTIQHSKCEKCIFHEECVSPGKRKASQGRCIDRYHTDGAVSRNRKSVENNKTLYKKSKPLWSIHLVR